MLVSVICHVVPISSVAILTAIYGKVVIQAKRENCSGYHLEIFDEKPFQLVAGIVVLQQVKVVYIFKKRIITRNLLYDVS